MDDELAELLAAGERAAFHGRPAAGIATLQKAVVLARDEDRDAEAEAAAWLLGVTLSAAGYFGSALTVLDPMLETGPDSTAEHRLFAALSSASIGSIHRQIGMHEIARGFDERGLAITDGQGEAAFDCLLGLAADAVGLGDATAAREQLTRAAFLVEGRSDWWRQRVRLEWARAEIALLEGLPTEAARRAAAAVTLAESSGAPRHVAKSLLFMGMAQVHAGEINDAVGTLRRASTLAESLGTQPLQWAARALLGALLVDSDPEESAKSLAAARTAVLQIAQDLPEALRANWLGRPDVGGAA